MINRNGNRLIALYGYPGCGKDTIASILAPEWTRVAFADPIREMLVALNPIIGIASFDHDVLYLDEVLLDEDDGMEGAKRKYPEVRRLLQRLGTEAGREVLGEDVWSDAAERKIASILDSGGRAVVTDLRFYNEYDLIRRRGGTVVQVLRRHCEGNGHVSEQQYPRFNPDFTIGNYGDTQQLSELVKELVARINEPPRVSSF